MMTEEMKMKLFKTMLELEHESEEEHFDHLNYFEQVEGAWKMLNALGLAREYLNWACNK